VVTPDITSASPEIRAGTVGSFARDVFYRRHPLLVAQVSAALPYPRSQRQALEDLVAESTTGLVAPPEEDSHDAAQWREWDREVFGQPWARAPFLWAECWFYRRLLESVGYFRPGPWRAVDPFGPLKDAELAGTGVDAELAALDALARLPERQRGEALLRCSLWGNQADLGFRVTASGPASARQAAPRQASWGQGSPGQGSPGGESAGRGLVADDSGRFWQALESAAGGTVCLLADNAGPELIPDLVLLDHLLSTGLAGQAVVYVKPQPYYVSDATTTDLLAAVHRMRSASGAEAARVGTRLHQALAGGGLDVQTHPFLCAPLPFTEMPQDLGGQLGRAAMTVVKGDLNYRRLVQDRRWPATTPFADVAGHFPSPVTALRTLKSEVAVGIAEDVVTALDTRDPGWRTNGQHAVIQTHPGHDRRDNLR
jgi:hypothetical protein